MQKKAGLGDSSVTYPLPVFEDAKGCKARKLKLSLIDCSESTFDWP